MLTVLPKGVQKKSQNFLTEDFFHLPPVSSTLVANLELRISPRIFEKILNIPNGIIRASGKLIHEKTRSQKSRDTVPLIASHLSKVSLTFYPYISCISFEAKHITVFDWIPN